MTSLPPPPGSDGDEFDFSALVAAHNRETESKRTQGRRNPGDGASIEPPSPGSSRGGDDRPPAGSGSSGGSRFWRVGYPVLVGSFLLVIVPLLVFAGLRVILDSSDGQLVKRVTDPSAPGYEAVVEKTPTAVAAVVAPDGSLDSAVVFALTSDSSGGVLLVPASLGVSTDFGFFPLSEVWKVGAVDSVAAGVGQALNLNFTEKITIAQADWTTLVGPSAPLSFTSPDAVRDAKDAVVFPKGTVNLKADQVASFLTSKGPKDNDVNRLIRDEQFWKAWLTKVKAGGTSFPVPTTSGIGRFIVSVARGQLSVSSLPVVPAPGGSPLPGGGPMYTVQEAAALDAVAAIVPFPDGAPGQRPRIRVLDGTGKLGNGLDAAIMLNAAGGQVDVVGNAKSFGQSTTQIIYFDGTPQSTAEKMRKALTMGELVESKQSNSGADMTVILGEDFLAKFGPSGGARAATTGPPTTQPTTSSTVRR